MTASPTAIPHAEASAHHHQPTTPPLNATNSFSRSPTGTSPKPLVSPIYTSAGRSAFSLPGPNSASTSPTTTSWYSAGFASNNSQRVQSPSSRGAVIPQKDVFTEAPAHYRAASFSSASTRSSSISSADLINEPTTPKATTEGGGGGGIPPLGRVPSMSMNGGSFEHIKGHRGSWGASANPGWAGFNNFRGGAAANSPPLSTVDMTGPSINNAKGGGGMGGLLSKFTFGGASAAAGQYRAPATVASSAPLPSADANLTVVQPIEVAPVRGRQASFGGSQKRRPSPMGERLLMGHFNAH